MEYSYNFSTTAGDTLDPAYVAIFSAIAIAYAIILIVICVVIAVALWKIFTKAGIPGWMALIPLLNIYKLFELAWGNGLLFLLMCIPFVNIVVWIVVNLKLAKCFGKSALFAIFGLILFQPIGYAILGLGKSEYQGIAE